MSAGFDRLSFSQQVLPGTYMNFVSASGTSAVLQKRGITALGLPLDWGTPNEIMVLHAESAARECQSLLGHAWGEDCMLPIREALSNASTLYLYRTDQGGTASVGRFATARYVGSRGNALTINITKSTTNEWYDVETLLDGKQVDLQVGLPAAALLEDNEYVEFHKSATLSTGIYPCSGGTDGTESAEAHMAFQKALEQYCPNTVGYAGQEEEIKESYVTFVKRMRDTLGLKCQAVLYQTAADYEGVISVYNTVSGSVPGALVYWIAGLTAAADISLSLVNQSYQGELKVTVPADMEACEAAAKLGHMVLYNVGGSVRILCDINTLVTYSTEKSAQFASNQTIRVIDQIATDLGVLFRDKYLGICPNDEEGRTSLWADIVKHHRTLQDMRAIESFEDGDITVTRGSDAQSVVITDCITVVNAMTKLYLTCYLA